MNKAGIHTRKEWIPHQVRMTKLSLKFIETKVAAMKLQGFNH